MCTGRSLTPSPAPRFPRMTMHCELKALLVEIQSGTGRLIPIPITSKPYPQLVKQPQQTNQQLPDNTNQLTTSQSLKANDTKVHDKKPPESKTRQLQTIPKFDRHLDRQLASDSLTSTERPLKTAHIRPTPGHLARDDGDGGSKKSAVGQS